MNAMHDPTTRRARRGRAPLALALLVAGSMFCGPASAQGTDADILAARAAFDRGDAAALAAIAPRVADHVLAPYVAMWQLDLAVDTVDPQAVHAFLRRWAGTPLADRLAADWLKSRARRGDWQAFVAGD